MQSHARLFHRVTHVLACGQPTAEESLTRSGGLGREYASEPSKGLHACLHACTWLGNGVKSWGTPGCNFPVKTVTIQSSLGAEISVD